VDGFLPVRANAALTEVERLPLEERGVSMRDLISNCNGDTRLNALSTKKRKNKYQQNLPF
jgi:hypothetical protein